MNRRPRDPLAPRPRHRPRRAGAAALAGALGLTVLASACAPAASPDDASRPANSVFTLTGHGWGHGRGMSQWGAQGAASLGVTANTILATYYPGTARTTVANSPIRVLVSADEGRDLQVAPAAGLTVTDALNHRLVLPAGPKRWRVATDPTGLVLQRLDANGLWTSMPVAGSARLGSPARFTAATPTIALVLPDGSSREYRGTPTAVRRSNGALYSVVAVPMESYLRGVVPKEMSPSWRSAALQAQAVAARTYAAQRRASAAVGSAYDICDSTACQVFPGSAGTSRTGVRTSYEYAASDAAVAATAGHIRTYNGRPAFTEFSASNGGWSVSGGLAYLPARADAWDGAAANSLHTWKATLPAAALEARYPAIGRLTKVRVTARDGKGEWGGRVVTVVLEGVGPTGQPTKVTTTGAGVAASRSWPGAADGLRSSWWQITNGAPVS
ncbi:MAG: stage sporulation protein [Frankiaceae bacterium]|nr:stage sporulation protein [Frankiaceae bacterium]